MKPLFRWIGGKRRMLPQLGQYVPEQFNTYIEPFMGAGALFYHLEHDGRAILNDMNVDLMVTYRVIRDHCKILQSTLAQMVVCEDEYYNIRASEPRDPVGIAARFIYLNRYAVNGMWRMNQKGQMNVPFDHRRGHLRMDGIDLFTSISKMSELLGRMDHCVGEDDEPGHRTVIMTGNYKNATRYAKPGDLVFMDPPYLPYGKNGFVKYTDKNFGLVEHEKLRDEFVRLVNLGCHVILTNSNTPKTHELYGRFCKETVFTKGSVARTDGQGVYSEIVITNLEKRA